MNDSDMKQGSRRHYCLNGTEQRRKFDLEGIDYIFWRINVMKKVLCMLIAVLLLVVVFSGCGGPTKPDPVPKNDNESLDESTVSKETPAVSEAP